MVTYARSQPDRKFTPVKMFLVYLQELRERPERGGEQELCGLCAVQHACWHMLDDGKHDKITCVN